MCTSIPKLDNKFAGYVRTFFFFHECFHMVSLTFGLGTVKFGINIYRVRGYVDSLVCLHFLGVRGYVVWL